MSPRRIGDKYNPAETEALPQVPAGFLKQRARSAKQTSVGPAKAVITPGVDAVCSGGFSLAVAALVIAYGWYTPEVRMNHVLVTI